MVKGEEDVGIDLNKDNVSAAQETPVHSRYRELAREIADKYFDEKESNTQATVAA